MAAMNAGRRSFGEDSAARSRHIAFAAITIAFPLILLVAVEAGLRVAGVGDGYPLFVPADSTGTHLVMNSRVSQRYFYGDITAPGATHDPFPAEKPPDTFRIFVQGGSTALGFPYFYGGAFPRMLEWRLAREFPDRRVEIVNTALTAVNSFTLLDFANEIIAQQPDAILIYAGHNEYYGAFGAGSALAAAGSPAMVSAYLRLRRFRIVQLISRAWQAIRSQRADDTGTPQRTTTMQRMVREQSIPLGSAVYARGQQQFRRNLGELLSRYGRAGIPVYIGTLVSNEREHPPFISAPQPGVGETEWAGAIERVDAALNAGDLQEVRSAAAAIVTRDSSNAAAVFSMARRLDEAGLHALAREVYLAAKDRDHLRFRAPEKFNEIIRELAAQHGARVVEVQEAFVKASPDGIVGGTLLTEHLHPNIDGYFEMASAYHAVLVESIAAGPPSGAVLPRNTARSDLPVTVVDSIYGELVVKSLLQSWPFASAVTPEVKQAGELPSGQAAGAEERIAFDLFNRRLSWVAAMVSLYAHYDSVGVSARARHVAEVLALERPLSPVPWELLAQSALRRDSLAAAERWLEHAQVVAPSHQTSALLGSLRLRQGDYAGGLEQYRRAAQLAPAEEPGPAAILGAVERLPGIEQRVHRNPADADALYELATVYALTMQLDRAEETVRALLVIRPDEERALRLQDVIRRVVPAGRER